jgi:hypothetical protein
MNLLHRYRLALLMLLVTIAVSTTGCAAVEGIFKAGVGVGVVIAVIVIGGALFLFSRVRGG